ncbi:MAG: hypothetical protein ABSG96_23025 [Terracidiphilus sp.]|jgi:hypothetical protein
MTTEIEFNDVPNFARVRQQIHAINPDLEFIKAGHDVMPDTYILRLQLTGKRRTDLRLSEELLGDLGGQDAARRNSELELEVHNALDRLK